VGPQVVPVYLGHVVGTGITIVAHPSFTAGAIVMAFSFSLGQLIAGRLILGIGVGGAAVICPLYITELAPTAARGRCVGTK